MAFDVSTADIETRWRPLSEDESDVAFARLDDAALYLRTVRPGLDAYVNGLAPGPARTDLEQAIRIALAEAVRRFLRNPDLLRSTTIGADGAVGVGYDNTLEALQAAGIYVSAGDLALVDAAVAAASGSPARSKVGSVRLRSSSPWSQPRPEQSQLPLP